MSEEEIIEIYRGLWRIEEAFKVTKRDLEVRPVYLSRHDHIQAHFLICFVALVIIRLLALLLGNKYSIPRIVESLNKASVCRQVLEQAWLAPSRCCLINADGDATVERSFQLLKEVAAHFKAEIS